MASGLRIMEFRPQGRLANYVRAFQVLSTDGSEPVSVLDSAGADVLVPFGFGDPIAIDGTSPTMVQSGALVGPRTRSVWLRFDGAVEQVNVSFLPGAAGAFVDLPLPELVGRVVPPGDVWPSGFREIVADLESLTVANQRISRLESLLLARLEPRLEPGPQVREVVRLIQANAGAVRVSRLAELVNLSVSQLERSFKRHVGVGPKMFARQCVRAALAEDVMASSNPDWALLAYKYGYADQAHLAREFREILTLTPSAFGTIGRHADFLQDALACSPLG